MSTYDEQKESAYLIYLDMNNLYGGAMCRPLPYKDFKWCDSFDLEQILKTPEDSETGYFLEVDIEYPEELHDKHSDYPILPENRIVSNSEMGGYTTNLKLKFQTQNSKINWSRTF